MNTKNLSLNFEKVIPTEVQIKNLYELLKKRSRGISHMILPSFQKHELFVKSHPYVVWYIVMKNNNCFGTIYLQEDNSVGINLNKNYNINDIECSIQFILSHFHPLPSIKSVRRHQLFINVSSDDKKLIKFLTQLGKKKFQLSYLI